jgi:hypothetical protein
LVHRHVATIAEENFVVIVTVAVGAHATERKKIQQNKGAEEVRKLGISQTGTPSTTAGEPLCAQFPLTKRRPVHRPRQSPAAGAALLRLLLRRRRLRRQSP